MPESTTSQPADKPLDELTHDELDAVLEGLDPDLSKSGTKDEKVARIRQAQRADNTAKKEAAEATHPKAFTKRAKDHADDVAEFVEYTRETLGDLAEEYAETMRDAAPDPGQERLAAAFRRVHGTFADLGRALDAVETTAADLAQERARLGS